MTISENDIKKAALAFLKIHYRYRPRSGDVKWKLDMITPDGIVADGVFSFLDEDEQPFLATFEATSFVTRDEVKYRFMYRAMVWDGLALSCIIVGLVVSYLFGTGAIDVVNWGIWGGALRLVGSILSILAIYVFMNRFRHRYRYIYAIEQFKRYHADEQWVAIGSDVFPNTDDKYLRELREQCIIGGFGLVSIQPDFDAQLLITPARVSLYGETRQAVDFITESQWMKRFRGSRWVRGWNKVRGVLPGVKQKLPQIGEKLQGGYEKVLPELTKRLPVVQAMTGRGVLLNRREFVNSLQRYRRGYWMQIALTTIGLTLIGGLFFNELLKAELIVLDNKKYLEEEDLSALVVNSAPEPEEYLVDTPYVAPYGEGGLTYLDEDKMSDPMLENERFDTEDISNNQSTQKENIESNSATTTTTIISRDSIVPNVESPIVIRPRPNSIRDSLLETGVGIYAADMPNNLVTYDCARFFNFDGVQYFIQEGVYPNRIAALKRMADLIDKGIESNYMWLGCFGENTNQYAVFLDYLTDDLIAAQATAREYRALIEKNLGQKAAVKVQQVMLTSN